MLCKLHSNSAENQSNHFMTFNFLVHSY